jgi:hypothetical protein
MTGDVADLLLEHQFGRAAAVEDREQHGRADRRMAGEGKLRRGRENAYTGAVGGDGRWRHKNGFGVIELTRDRLHGGGVQPIRIEHDGERIAGEFLLREDIEGEEAAFHGNLTRAKA